jgi:hypothetical protein
MASKDLKITFSGDTKSYRQEVDKAAVATAKFEKDAGKAMNSLADAFGVDADGIKSSLEDVSKGFSNMLGALKASTAGATMYERAMKIIKIATISTGIGALIVALGSLVAYFTQTERGAEFVERAMSGLKASLKVITDHAAKFGEGLFLIFSGKFQAGWTALKESFSGIGSEIVSDAKAASELTRRFQELEDAEKQLALVNTERRANARELFAQAKEEGTTAENKKRLIKEAMALEALAYNEEKVQAKERLDIHTAQVALGEARDEQNHKTLELQGAINNLSRDAANSEMSYSKALKGATKEIAAKAEVLKKSYDEARKQAIEDVGGKPKKAIANEVTVTTNMKDGKNDLKNVQKYKDQLNNANIATQNAADEMAKKTLDLSSTLNSAWGGAADGLGTFLGDLISGKASVSDFGSFVAMQFADLAVTVGKQMIAFGATGIALKLLIKNPWLALAAGVALVAVGTAAKSKISASIASGGGGATSAAGGGGSGDYNYDARQSMGSSKMQNINVTVGGEFTLKNGVLVAGINQENQRKLLVT